MANVTSVIPRLDDKSALEIFRELQTIEAPQGMTLEVAGFDNLNILESNAAQATIARFAKPNTFLITRISLNYPNFNLYFVRNQDPGRLSPFYDEIQINHNANQGGLDPNRRTALIELLNSKTTLGNVHRRDAVAEKSIEDLQTIYHSTILKLETAFADQIKKITDWTVEQTSALEQHKLKLTAETSDERERLSKEHESKSDSLRLREEELEARRKEIDDRAYMHARRGIRADLRNTIKERQTKFTLTPETTRLRMPVHIVMIALLVALATVNVVTLLTILHLDLERVSLAVLIWAFAKQTLVTLAFVGALFFYIRWMNRWFEQHASAEFLLKQFELDIDRASWVVESAMEWRDQKSEIPAPLLEGITRNLFSDRAGSADTHSATDDLASALVGNASQLKLKIGENELNFDRKGISGLDKTEVPK